MRPMFMDQTDSNDKKEIKFSIDRKAYIIRGLVSGFFIFTAVLLRLFDLTGALVPFAGFFLVWGAGSIHVLLKSPVFRLTGEALIVSHLNHGKSLRLPLDSLICITSDLLLNPRARRRTIFVSNGINHIIIPPFLDIGTRRILKLLVERTTALVEKAWNLHMRDRVTPGCFPPPALWEIIRKFQDQGMGEKVFLFKGPVKKISLFRRLFRKICAMLYLMMLGLGFAVSENVGEFYNGALVVSVFFGLLFLFSYISSRQKGEEWLLMSPPGIAMIGKRMAGELFWNETTGIKYLRSRKFVFSFTGAQRSPSGLVLVISTRDSIYIPISDLYDVPLPCIERILIRHAQSAGARF